MRKLTLSCFLLIFVLTVWTAENSPDVFTDNDKFRLEHTQNLFSNINTVVKGLKSQRFSTATTAQAKQAARKYLLRFGWLEARKFSSRDLPIVGELKKFQKFANLKETGKVDVATITQMSKPRCGALDPSPSKIVVARRTRRKRRYVHQGTKWVTTQNLRWKLLNRGRTLDAPTIKALMRRAFKYWSDKTNLNFIETPNYDDPEIFVKFKSAFHGDPYSFDGEGGTLAHAFYPHNEKGLSGDVHFDDDENFTDKSKKGRNLLWVATHEIGHSIGLEHSNVQEAVMYPWYTEYKPGFELNYDDVVGIQTLYGSRRVTEKPMPKKEDPMVRPTPTPVKPEERTCLAGVSAMYYMKRRNLQVILTTDNKISLIRGKKTFTYGPYSLKPGKPLPRILRKFRSIGIITAAFTPRMPLRKNGRIKTHVVFTGMSYYYMEDFRKVAGPFSIHERKPNFHTGFHQLNLDLPRTVTKIDAAMLYRRNNLTYIFSGSRYWRYGNHPDNGYAMHSEYPRDIKLGWGSVMPNNIDATVSTEELDFTYFVKDEKLYKLNEEKVRVADTYPQHVGYKWLNCGGETASIRMPGSLRIPNSFLSARDEP